MTNTHSCSLLRLDRKRPSFLDELLCPMMGCWSSKALLKESTVVVQVVVVSNKETHRESQTALTRPKSCWYTKVFLLCIIDASSPTAMTHLRGNRTYRRRGADPDHGIACSPQPLSNSMLTRIPPEIFDMFIDHLHDDKHTLMVCSLVCNSWLRASHYHLFRSLVVSPRNAHVPLFQHLLSAPFSAFPKHVVHFTMGDKNHHPQVPYASDGANPSHSTPFSDH
jgi:hypothetical protein